MGKRYAKLLLCFATAITTMACEDIDLVKSITLSCHTQGFSDGATQTNATWESDEHIYLLRAEDWSSAILSLQSGADSDTAKFSGSSAGTRTGYYAVRPASAAGAVRDNGSIEVQVKNNNIFLADENSSMVAPQIGSGDESGLSFKSLFGAAKFEVSAIEQCSQLSINIPNEESCLYGRFLYNFLQGSLQGEEGKYSVTRVFSTPLNLTEAQPVYVALPAGTYSKIELIAHNDREQNSMLYVAENVKIRTNSVTNCSNVSQNELSALIGSWRLKSFCGSAAEVDLYIDFSRYGTFTILQRTDNLVYTTYEGTYTANSKTSVVTGVYSDGTAWVNSYKFSLDNDNNLVLESIENPSEISVYESTDMPTPSPQSVSRAARNSVKPL
ncbi:MAG: hypothetical protein IKA26_02560 [Alistipes sp.]|nr:hypothetical protein [Alistipes sp.]